MSLQTFLIFALTMLLGAVLPGPAVFLGINSGIKYGRKKSTATALGISTAALILAALSAAGLGAVLITSSTIFIIIKWVGGIYIIYMGIKTWMAGNKTIMQLGDNNTEADTALNKIYKRALFVGLSNPKAIIHYAAIFPQFIDTSADLSTQYTIMLGTSTLIVFATMIFYSTGGHFIASWFKNLKIMDYMNRIFGAVFILLGIIVLSSDAIGPDNQD